MREILFRAKHKEWDEWVEGDLIHEPFGDCIQFIKNECRSKIKVKPETVCQYTGLTDKNGRKIFEGDIVSAPFVGYASKTKIKKGVVEFVKGAFSVNWNDSEEYGKNFVGYVNGIEVIGNIFDNPELIGE